MHEGQAYFEKGLVLAARESLENRLVEARTGDGTDLCTSLNGLGSVLLELNMLSQAAACFSESVQVSVHGPMDDQVRSWCNLSLCQYLSGLSEDCADSAEKAYSKAQVLKDENPGLYLHSLVILGLGYIACAKWKQARDIHEAALQMAQDFHAEMTIAKLLNNLGLINVELADFGQAEKKLIRAEKMLAKLGEPSALAYTTTELGRLHLKRGDLAQALHYGSSALRMLWDNMSGVDKVEIARLCELFGTVAYETGDRQGAVNYLQRAVTYYGHLDRWQEWEKASATLTKVLRSPNKPVQTRVVIDRADKELLRYFTALLGLMDTLDSLYPHLRGRSELVAKYSTLLGMRMEIDQESLQSLIHAARLYDVGLTSMASDVDDDYGSLAGEQPLLGEQVLHMFYVPKEIRSAVRHHREWYDGSGGPDGLRGDEIPFFSRIIAVVSGYISFVLQSDDAKTSHTMGMKHLLDKAGTKYDPNVVEQFEKLHYLEGN